MMQVNFFAAEMLVKCRVDDVLADAARGRLARQATRGQGEESIGEMASPPSPARWLSWAARRPAMRDRRRRAA
jgi:hypothetical protein